MIEVLSSPWAYVEPTLSLRAVCSSPWPLKALNILLLWQPPRLTSISMDLPGSPSVPWSPEGRNCLAHPRFPGIHVRKAFMKVLNAKWFPCQNLAWYISKVFLKKICAYIFHSCICKWLNKLCQNLESWNGEHLVCFSATVCFYLTCVLCLFLLAGLSLWIPIPHTET